MIFGQKSLFDFPGNSLGKKATHIILAPTVKKDVSLEALLEEPIEKKPTRNPLEWIGASAMHILILAALSIIPLYTTGTIHLGEYKDIPLVAPPPPPPPAAVVASAPAVPHAPVPHAIVLHTHRLIAPISIPKKISLEQTEGAAPSLGGVIGGVPDGVAGGQLGGAENGVPGAAGNAPPPPLPVAKPVQQKRIVRAGSSLKPPRKTFSVDPEYSAIARQAHIGGVVMVDAIIDEQGNVVQAHALSGPPLLIPSALKAVLQWKYEPTALNGQPVSVELEVQVNFAPKG
jgi:protein TonB